MENIDYDPNARLLPPKDLESGTTKTMRAFSLIEANGPRESFLSRSRLQSRQNYRHYTQSIYNELSRARDFNAEQEEKVSDSFVLHSFDEIDGVKLIRDLEIRNKELEGKFYLEEIGSRSREAFKGFNWTLASNNSFYFHAKPTSKSSTNKTKNNKQEPNFVYSIKTEVESRIADIYWEDNGENRKIGNLVKQETNDFGDMTLSDMNDSQVYKIVEDPKPTSVNLNFIVLDLVGNKVGAGEIVCEENNRLSCRLIFPEETHTKEKILVLTGFIFKMMYMGIGSTGKAFQEESLSSDSCFFWFLRSK